MRVLLGWAASRRPKQGCLRSGGKGRSSNRTALHQRTPEWHGRGAFLGWACWGWGAQRAAAAVRSGSLRLTLLALACCADCVQWPSEPQPKPQSIDRSIQVSTEARAARSIDLEIGGGSARFRSRLADALPPRRSSVGLSNTETRGKSCASQESERSIRNETNGGATGH